MIKDDNLKKIFQDVGMTETELDRITPKMEEEIHNSMQHAGKYRIVAEVVSSQFCASGMKPGMKFVVDDGHLNTQETTAPLCLGALGPLCDKTFILFDRMAQQGEKPINSHMSGYHCLDPGFDLGGWGNTQFKVTVEPID
jgi:uncharacterized repeat protein (TIGR04076 family)